MVYWHPYSELRTWPESGPDCERHQMYLSFRGARRLTVAAALLVTAMLAACSSTDSSSTAPMSQASSRSASPHASTAPVAMTKQAAEVAMPSNLTDQTVPSVFVTDLKIGQTGFTDVDELSLIH